MSTSSEYVNITQKKLLGYRDLNDRFFSYLMDSLKEKFSHVWDEDIVLGDQLTLEADGADAFKITGDSIATDGIGNLLKISDSLVHDDISFENTNSVNYYVALKYTEIPNEIDINPSTGYPEYRGWIEEIGEKAIPNYVTDNGDDTITLRVDNVTESGVDNSGRQVLVYKEIAAKDATTSSIAIEICTVSWTGTYNEITTTYSLGQSTISTITNDYKVVLLGPTVKRYVDLREESGYVFIGIIEGNGGTPTSFDMTEQNITSITVNDFADLEKEMRLLAYMGPRISSPDIDSYYNAVHRNSWYPPYNYGLDTNRFQLGSGLSICGGCSAIIDGRLKNIYCARSITHIYIVDDETLSVEYVNLSAYFPATNSDWNVISMCRDENRLFVVGIGLTTFATVLHCFDIETWEPYTGWTTGTVIGSASNTNVTGISVINADDDYVAVSNPEVTVSSGSSSAVSIFSKSDGTLLGSGAGDCPSVTSGSVKWITSNGTYVFFVIEETATAYVCSMSITSPGANGCGESGWPHQDFNKEEYVDIIAFGDTVFVSINDESILGYIYNVYLSTTVRLDVDNASSPYCKTFGRLACDGSHIWALGSENNGAYDRSKLFKIDIRQLTLVDSLGAADGVSPLVTPYEFEFKTSNHFQSSPDVAVKPRTPLFFNGKDIWVVGNDFTQGASNGKLQGYLYRVPRVFNL
jgi:hypothetical protein